MSHVGERPAGPAGFEGQLLTAEQPGYEDARRVHNGIIDKRPALIARCEGPSDVSAAVRFAAEQGAELSIRGGGHNVAGRAVTDGGVMVDLSQMRGVGVDPGLRTARAEGGATWGDVDLATQAHGLAVTGGMISSTGVAGLTLGGGIGWLMGRHGLSADNLLAAEVVTADGSLVRASEDEHPDLFWALRGGGGNFGVVTAFEFGLHPVGPEVNTVSAAYPYSEAAATLRLYRDLTSAGSDDLTMNGVLRHAVDDPSTQVAGMLGCHLGSAAEARAELDPLFSAGRPVERELTPLDYTTLNSVLDAAYPKGALNYWKSAFLRELSDDAIDTMVEWFQSAPSPMSAVVIEYLHGAVARVPVDATAFPHREPAYNFLITSVWLDPGETDRNVAWTRAFFQAMEPFTAARQYVNYVAADEAGTSSVRQAFGPNYERLVAVKRAYDPENLFRLNQNVDPRS